MIKVYAYNELGFVDHGWLKARHHFSFASYQNPARTGFGVLKVINDDAIQAGQGFATHGHANMEIITYVRSGAITHTDSQGNQGRTQADDVQVMSAGSGIRHAEYNLEEQTTTLYQIWITPQILDVPPRWATAQFPNDYVNEQLTLLVSGDGQAPLTIQQQAFIYAGKLQAGTVINHAICQQAYLLLAAGQLRIDGQDMQTGDGAEVSAQSHVQLQALTDAEVIVIDVPET